MSSIVDASSALHNWIYQRKRKSLRITHNSSMYDIHLARFIMTSQAAVDSAAGHQSYQDRIIPPSGGGGGTFHGACRHLFPVPVGVGVCSELGLLPPGCGSVLAEGL